jgi:predicted nucleic acid-binding protein
MLEDYLPFVEIVAIPDPPPVIPVPCRDNSDTIFVQLAIVAAADFVVTGDADLTALRESSPVRVITVGELRRILTG